MPPLLGHSRALTSALLAVTLVTGGCGGRLGDAPAGPSPSIQGRWSGSAILGAVQFDATFEQEGEAVTGSGDFSSPLGSGPFAAVGTVAGSSVELTLTSAEFGTGIYRGHFESANRITGTLDAPDFSDIELPLERQ